MTESNPDKTTRAILAISENQKELERKARTEKPRKRNQQEQAPKSSIINQIIDNISYSNGTNSSLHFKPTLT